MQKLTDMKLMPSLCRHIPCILCLLLCTAYSEDVYLRLLLVLIYKLVFDKAKLQA